MNGNEQPRGLGAVAKTLSMDMRAQDKAWLRMKLDILARTAGDDAFDCPMPPDGKPTRVPSMVAAFARIVRYRVDQLARWPTEERQSPVLDALFAKKEPKTGTDGTMSWTVDVFNPQLGRRLRADASRSWCCPTASAGPTRCGWRATIRARWTACASCCRSTCA